MSIYNKIRKNLQQGTLLKAGYKALSGRLIKWVKYHNVFYPFDYERVMTRKVQQTIPLINRDHIKMGNYYIDRRLPLTEKSIVYSLGVWTNIEFDLAITKAHCCPVYMYDPTPISIEFMEEKAKENTLLRFFPWGVWTEDTTLKFYLPPNGSSASAVNGQNGVHFEAECKTIANLMAYNGHQHIDVLKADIEGAALPIIEQLIETEIYPTQIVVEFERPIHDLKGNIDFFHRLIKLRERLAALGYEEFRLPRSAAKYFSFDLLFSRIHKNTAAKERTHKHKSHEKAESSLE
ncbi:MAG: FkbM family methyltransferase [Bacteroidota bacterium]